MSLKRRNTSSAEPESPKANCELRPQENETSFSYDSDEYESPRIDVATGQAGAFPGLTESDDLFYGPATNGLDYLRMVRSEAKNIPQLLTAPSEPSESQPINIVYGDIRDGFFLDDQAYIAAPVVYEEPTGNTSKIQSLYYETLLAHFNLLRATLRCSPPLNKIQSLSPMVPISFPVSSKAAKESWERHITAYAPNPVQIACMDAESVFELIRLFTKKMMILTKSQDATYLERIGAWIWAALGKCPDRGHLSSEEISELRALARRADATLRHALDSAQDDVDDSNHRFQSDKENAEVALGLADSTVSSVVGQPEGDRYTATTETRNETSGMDEPMRDVRIQQIQIIHDMIITLVGEVYGQHDLLNLRKRWNTSRQSSNED